MKIIPAILAVSMLLNIVYGADKPHPYQNPNLPVEERVEDLLSRMTPEEKFWQTFMIPDDLSKGKDRLKHGVFGLQVATKARSGGDAAQMLNYGFSGSAKEHAELINRIQKVFVEETRLGIPIIAFDEALHGLVRDGATAFPQAIALAATWDQEFAHTVFRAIALETRTRGIRQVLSPVINIARDVRWGRVEETYGEDPYLISKMGVAFVKAFEEQGVVTTPKHFVANVGDGGRDSYPVGASEWLLNEVYFPGFNACFREGGAQSVMTSYNSLNGQPCTAHPWLLNDILKKKWDFDGFVISDAGAVGGILDLHHTVSDREGSAEQAIEDGLDVIFQTAWEHHIPLLKAVKTGMIDEEALDEAVRRVLRAKFKLGLFEEPYTDPHEAEKWNNHEHHRTLAREAARKSIVLLKNQDNVLPLSKNLVRLAVIGEDATEGRLGGYSGPGNDIVTILQGIKDKLGSNITVDYHPGCGRSVETYETIPGKYLSYTVDEKKYPGLMGQYYNGIEYSEPVALRRNDLRVAFKWTLFSPDPALEKGWFSVRWTGQLTAPQSGDFRIGLEGNEGFRLYLDGEMLIDRWRKAGHVKELVPVTLQEGREYDIKIEFYDNTGRSEVRLIWDAGVSDQSDQQIEEAYRVAEEADVVVVVAGIEEGEFQDRARLHLPGKQEDMILKLAELDKPLVVLLVGGSAITMNRWIDMVPAVIDVWYPGEMGGHAVADVLFGDYNPAGRLPVTFPQDVAQVPLYYNHFPTGRGDDYIDMTGFPRYPFGHGLSYSEFEYSGLTLSEEQIDKAGALTLGMSVKNVSDRDGEEVVQLYVRDLVSTIVRPVMALKGFKRIFVKAGEEKQVQFTLQIADLGYYHPDGSFVIEPGRFEVMIGGSSADIRLKRTFHVSE